MEKNKELDLYSTAFRMYNPALARFNGMDPAASVLASYSPYHFSYNNPVNYSDPSGAFPGGNPMMGQIPPWVNEHGEDTRYMNENYGMDWNPFKTGRIGPGSGNHWADGIGRHDWTLHGGSESYRQELAYTKMYGGYELDGKLYTSDGHPINWSAGGITVKKFTGEVSDTFVGEDGNTYFYKYYRNVFVPFGSSQDEEGDIKKMGELSPNSAYVKRAYEVDGWTLFDEFKSGVGPEYSIFMEGHPVVEDLRNSWIVGIANSKYALDKQEPLLKFDVPFGLVGLAMSHTFTEQVIGGARISIIPVAGGRLYIVDNTMDRYSYHLHMDESIKRNPMEITPKGTTYHRFIWFEK